MNRVRATQLLYFVVAVVLGTIAYRGLSQRPMQVSEAAQQFTCVEFNSTADAERFRQTNVIPAGSKLSNKSALECTGVRLNQK